MSQPNFTGMTRPAAPDWTAKCPDACTPEHCIISTVASCKHPCTSPDRGCGPVTMANRKKAAAFLGILPASPMAHTDVVR